MNSHNAPKYTHHIERALALGNDGKRDDNEQNDGHEKPTISYQIRFSETRSFGNGSIGDTVAVAQDCVGIRHFATLSKHGGL
jgi:hypothetical protein